MTHAKHIVRAILLIMLCVGCFEIFRQWMRPESFGELGHFRANAIRDMEELPINYFSGDACNSPSCHESQSKSVKGGKHATIDCQMCHGPLDNHADGEKKLADMPVDHSPDLCLRCHELLPARPVTIKQIDFAEHMK